MSQKGKEMKDVKGCFMDEFGTEEKEDGAEDFLVDHKIRFVRLQNYRLRFTILVLLRLI